jgi:DNA ligase D-like protein (predicted 3'-phosphoesterase)
MCGMFQYPFSFVEHHSTYKHHDFRVGLVDDALSYSITDGPSMVPNLPRLAVEMPRHSRESMFSEKTIPPGRYGAGERRVWDCGHLTIDKDILIALEEGYAKFFLNGSILRGHFEFKILPDWGREWELIKLEDEYADPNFVLVPVLPKLEKRQSVVLQQTLF